jgi:predicted 2-oxoglutarate/Fe(II)-dependent dioxygenase YbiX
MPKADFFSRLGMFVDRGFLEPDLCRQFLAEARSADSSPATVVRRGATLVDETFRRTLGLALPPKTISYMETRFLALKPALEKHFNLPLSSVEELQFLRYREGDFFGQHRDSSGGPYDPDFIKLRKVSVVLFLNSQEKEPAPGIFCGGALTIFGLSDDPQWQAYGFPLVPEEGLLVGFRSEIVHQVEAVTAGERFTVVTWYF